MIVGNRTWLIWSALVVLSLPLLWLFSIPRSKKVSNAGRATEPQPFYHRLAYFHAPIYFQDTEVRGESQDEGNPASTDQPLQRRGDFITRFDFDGDWNGLNNWINFAKRPPGDYRKDKMARATMYYSVVETTTHYFIVYCAYHAQDREPRCSDGECHENDLEGGLHMVRKGPENEGMGTLWLIMYLAHDDWFTYLTPAGREAGIRLGGKPPHETAEKAQHYNADFIYDVIWRGIAPNGTLFAPRDPHVPFDSEAPPGTILRPTIWSEPWGHGMYGWPGPEARSPYARYRKPEYPWKEGFINGDGVIYYPGMKAGIPDYHKEVDLVPYGLIDIFEPDGLWDRRAQIDWNMDGCGGGANGTPNCTWGYFGTFRGERWGADKANAPWRWDHMDDHLPPGMQAFEPLRLVEEYNNLSAVPADQLSHTCTNNRYLGIPSGTRSDRPPPIANAGARVIVVTPGEPFVLDGGRSRTADLNGRGQLLYQWDSETEGWGERGWTTQSWLPKTIRHEGTYRVKLTVSDGDHDARDDVRVVISSRKLFFDDFQKAHPQPSWRFLGQTWEQKDGLLTMRRPGAGLNAALVTDQAYPSELTVETLMQLDLLYPEANAPFGVGLAYQNPTKSNSALLFGFVGTRRIDTLQDPGRQHLTEVAFLQADSQRQMRLGKQILTYHDAPAKGYQLRRWYHVKLAVEGGLRLKAKVWPLGESQPDWMYQVMLEQPMPGAPMPLLSASTGTNGEARFDYFWVSNK